jgi:hypothetical protein
MSETVNVTITATERVRYSRTLDMPKDAYEAYLKAREDGRGESWFGDFAEAYLLAGSDASDSDGYKDVEVTAHPSTPA